MTRRWDAVTLSTHSDIESAKRSVFYFHVKPLAEPGRRVPLTIGTGTLGRDPTCTLRLDEFGVSGRHAQLHVEHRTVRIRDLGSGSGTFLNGVRIEEATLVPGDRILLGSVLLVLQNQQDQQETLPERAVFRRPGEGSTVAEAPTPQHQGEGVSPVIDLADLLQDVLTHAAGAAGDEALHGALTVVLQFTGAVRASLLSVERDGGYVLRASAGEGEDLILDRRSLQHAKDTGSPACVEGGTAGLCLPIALASRATGVVYLHLPAQRLEQARRDTTRLAPVLSLMGLLMRRNDEQDALARAELSLAGAAMLLDAAGRSSECTFTAHSRAMAEALAALDRVADATEPVLLLGESRVGKRRAARYLHTRVGSRRSTLLTVECAAPHHDALEIELFGLEDETASEHAMRRGKLELAGGGTLLVDEVTALPAPLQHRLVDAIRTGQAFRGGGSRPYPVTARVVAAASSDLSGNAERGDVVADLFEMLGRHPIRIPPLRERREDIIPLAREFMRRDATELHKPIVGLSVDACRALRDHPWKGNVGELQAVVSRAVVLAEDGIVDVDLLPLDIAAGPLKQRVLDGLFDATELSWRDAKTAFEKTYFEEMLSRYQGNVSRGSRRAGIARKSFYSKLKQLGLTPR